MVILSSLWGAPYYGSTLTTSLTGGATTGTTGTTTLLPRPYRRCYHGDYWDYHTATTRPYRRCYHGDDWGWGFGGRVNTRVNNKYIIHIFFICFSGLSVRKVPA